jgi:hypothetical protein
MKAKSNNYSAQNLVSSHEPEANNELEPSKTLQNPPLRTPFKIRKQTTIGFERAEW